MTYTCTTGMSARASRIDGLLELLDKEVRSIYQSGRFREFLKFLSAFHGYSASNSLLIHVQNPSATRVAGLVTWGRLGRRILPGSTALWILAPVPCSRTVSEEVRDAAGNPLLDATTGKPLRRSLQLRATFFKPVPIYDISQTEGRAIPEFATELQSTQLGCAELMDAVRRVSTAPIGFGRMRGGVQGSYSPSTHRITVKSGLSEAMTLKTMLHEVVHSRLHRTPEPDIRPADILKSLRRVEIEAEATSFIVLNAFEIDVASYSFDYICSWSASQELRELHEALDTIRRESGILIEELEEALEGDEPIAS